MGNTSTYTPFPTAPVIQEPKMDIVEEDQQWLNIKSIIAAIRVPKPNHTTRSFSEESTPVEEDDDDTAALLLPKVVDSAASEPAGNAYGTFNANNTTTETEVEEEEERTIVPLHPHSLLASAALTPVYLILMLLPMLPFWIFTGFLCYVAATTPLAEIHVTLVALAFLLPFNALGTAAIIRFALNERRRAVQSSAEEDVEVASPVSRSSSGSFGSEKRRLWRPSMQFVLYGARREGRRL